MAARLGASFLGVILAPGRSRSRTLSEASAIFDASPGPQRVGVFVDASVDEMVEAVSILRLDVVQLHGSEPAAAAPAVREANARSGGGGRVAVWKAIRVQAAGDIAAAAAEFGGSVDALLLEGWSAAGHGGVGARFDWTAAAAERAVLPASLQVVVAGGLDPDNVAAAVARLRPDVVDVSSGVEESPCRKSAERVRAFIAAAHAAAG